MLFPTHYVSKPPVGAQLIRGHPLAKGLVGAWLLNEGNGLQTFDLSGNDNHGAFGAGTAAPTWKLGRIGPALDFDGGDYVKHNESPSVDITDKITIEVLIFSDTMPESYIVAKRDGDNKQYGVYILSDKRLGFYTWGVNNSISTSETLNTGEWYHIVIAFDSSIETGEIYFNGIPKATDIQASAITTATSDIFIGARGNGAGGATSHFTGIVALLRIYNRILNINEAKQLYYDPYCMFAQPMEAELFYAPAIMNQFQKANLGADLYDGVLIT